MDKHTKQTDLIKTLLSIFISLVFAADSHAQIKSLDFYLPDSVEYDQNIAKPAEVLGYEIGEFHATHDKIVYYLHLLAQQSDRISMQKYGETHEKRPLFLLTISSPKNLGKIEEIKKKHWQLSQGKTLPADKMNDMPVVVWLGYSVHGNESSGSNAALLVTYYLAAAKSQSVNDLLEHTIILIDPAINPDGLQRFSTWVNANRSKNLVGDNNSREFDEPWPGGRTNHYWFDLNRDWLLLQQPESKGRIIQFHQWKPNVVTDHHEMGSNSTLFFQPGVPSRKHPLTPEKNVELTQLLAQYHARALDRQSQLYYSQEDYDDFYFGKGSTYPDLNGAIGILFEQASSRGHLRETDNGVLDFPSTIKNQLTVSFSTLQASYERRQTLLEYQAEFYQNAMADAATHANEAYIFGDESDPYRTDELARILKSHEIEVYRPYKDVGIGNRLFKQQTSYLVPLNQPQYLLIQAIFEKRKNFRDSLFYDISAWSLDLAFNLEISLIKDKSVPSLIEKSNMVVFPEKHKAIQLPESNYGYVINWNQYHSPAVLNQLLNEEIIVKAASEKFYPDKSGEFSSGSLLIPLNHQTTDSRKIHDLLQELSNKYQVNVYPVSSGATKKGIDLGSPKFKTIEKKKILLVTGEGVNPSEAGEIWFLLDNKMDITVTLCNTESFKRINLFDYSTLILPDGNYNDFSGGNKLKSWLSNGGIIIAQNDAVKWLKNKSIFLGNLKMENLPELNNITYGKREEYKGSQIMSGGIFKTKIDVTHPLCYGYQDDYLAVFKNNKLWLETSSISFNNPVVFTKDPLLAGYISDKNLELLSNTSGVSVTSSGKGKIIAFSFDPNFRAFWYGTEKLFLNSIFFGNLIETHL